MSEVQMDQIVAGICLAAMTVAYLPARIMGILDKRKRR